jgi:hypothetical protein
MKSVKNEVFVWTEAFNCGEILQPMLSSYIRHNNYPIYVYGTKSDLNEVSIKSDLIIFKTLSNKKRFFKSTEEKILKGYRKGHKGTTILWDYLISSRTEKIFIHLDSDTIFLNDVVTDLIQAIKDEGNSIAGSRRAYKNRGYRKNGRDGHQLNLRPDCVNTDCFAFTTEHIKKWPRFWLRRKISGRRVSPKPVVDFFDPVTFEIIKKSKKIKYMDSPHDGYQSTLNKKSKFVESRISFAAVGSGCNFYKNGHKGIPEGYSGFALASYSLFAKELLGKNIDIPPLDDKEIISKLSGLNKIKWERNS